MIDELLGEIEAKVKGSIGGEGPEPEPYRRLSVDGPSIQDVIKQLVERGKYLQPATREEALATWHDAEGVQLYFDETPLKDLRYFRFEHPLALAANKSPEHFHLTVAHISKKALVAIGPQTRSRHEVATEEPGELPDPAPWSEKVADAIDEAGMLPGPFWWQSSFGRQSGDALLVADVDFDALLYRFLVMSRHLSHAPFTPDGLGGSTPLLVELLTKHLKDSQIITFGSWANFDVFFLGRAPSGKWVGLQTAAVWT
ncbi:MAG: nuclease A inhibitor family protein [Myxococcota bacterium]